MSQVGNSQDRSGGQYMVQDSDHMGESSQGSEKANRGRARQSEQSQKHGRQIGSFGRMADRQQGDEWLRHSN